MEILKELTMQNSVYDKIVNQQCAAHLGLPDDDESFDQYNAVNYRVSSAVFWQV